MKFGDLFRKRKSESGVPIIISQYSNLPRFYTINGVKYDIDSAVDIERIPLFKAIMQINGEDLGMDAVLLEHGIQARQHNDAVYRAAICKVNQFRARGIVSKSKREIEQDKAWQAKHEQQKVDEGKRKVQCDNFTIDDMYQFTGIPFGWHWVTELSHTDGVAWFMLNMNNQQIAIHYISQLNEIIIDSHEYVDQVQGIAIDLYNIDFGLPTPMYRNSVTNTRVECYPYTKTGKVSKYPVKLVFRNKPGSNEAVYGEVKILKDGNIGSAKVQFSYRTGDVIAFTFGLYGLSLVLKKVDMNYETIYRFEDVEL